MELDKENLDFWKENSYLFVPGLFSDNKLAMSDWVDEVARWERDDSKWLTNYEMGDSSQITRRENFVPYHPGLSNILNGEKALSIVSQLMGEQAFLYKDRINFKYCGGGPHAAHQDGVAYEQGKNSQFDDSKGTYVSILVSVDHATPENGCLEVVPGWGLEKLDMLRMEAPFPDKPHYTKIAQDIEDSLKWKKMPTKPGDALFFTERLPHRSASNNSNFPRRILYGVFNPASEGNIREAYYNKKRKNQNDPQYFVGNPHSVTE